MSFNESEEVAEDYRQALEDLTTNARFEISNLTLIARENTEHALAISQAIQDHIKKTAPQKKLPALYVLDSIVKNVGTPYTLFFGSKLYSTFMDAYASVDNNTRRKMHEMLKTWKEPVAGSVDPRPVFSPDTTRPIENALMKASESAFHAQQRQQHFLGRGRPIPQSAPYRETPTPPGFRPASQANGYPNQQPPAGNGGPYGPPTAVYPSHTTQYPSPSVSASQPVSGVTVYPSPAHVSRGTPQPGISVDSLNEDIERVIVTSKAQFAQNPQDQSIQTRLKALLDLQSILRAQSLPQEQLVLVKNQIAELAVNARMGPPAHTSTPVSQTPAVAVAPPPLPTVQAAGATPKVSLDSLLGPGALAAIMARQSTTPQVPTPQPPPLVATIRSPPPPQAEPRKSATPLSSDPGALLAMLRKSGLLSVAPTPSGGTPNPPPNPSSSLPFPFPLPGMAPPIPLPIPGASQSFEQICHGIDLKASSLKQYRPQLLPLLYDNLGPQCTQCGRRFKTDDEGKKKKTAHMDWHFKVNQRIAELEKRGQHRSWYVDELDWIRTRETVDEDHPTQSGEQSSSGIEAGGSGSGKSKGPLIKYLPVPDDPVLANSVCPICQEKFEKRWLDDAQDFVWYDAIQVGSRIYHASCHSEATLAYSRATPEPAMVLGKRKAEDELPTNLKGRLKMEAT